MKIYLAGEREGSKNDEINIWRNAKRRLFSYYYHGFKTGGQPSVHIEAARGHNLELFLDSGAFTAFTKKETIPPANCDVLMTLLNISIEPMIWLTDVENGYNIRPQTEKLPEYLI